MKPLPLVMSVLIVPALIIHVAPDPLRETLLFNRDALARGELWRCLTGHWVHFSNSHLMANLAALVLIAVPLERHRRNTLIPFLTIAAPLITALLWLFEPNLATYGGLSGIATGCALLLSLHRLRDAHSTSARLLWASAILAISLKATADLFSWSLVPHSLTTTDSVRVSTWAHAAGAITGIFYFVFLSRRDKTKLPITSARALTS